MEIRVLRYFLTVVREELAEQEELIEGKVMLGCGELAALAGLHGIS